ncbi:hypothetical protein [Yinghuangia seranimata]|uniref:hypothetical protein n=1 Tax=Yinghuangia seranimata TaxID=408067 RepID=UPI00248AAC27|nr:hypothetical protein [Yinghuangia seranimata]MDI2126156.1 hypothetical protein [Yinghuangia seranimata]
MQVGMIVLYVLFVPVGLWLLTETMWQHGAPFRYRVLAVIGFAGVVFGVALGNGIVSAAGGFVFVVGQFLVTRYVRSGYYHGWTVSFGRKKVAKRGRRRSAEKAVPEQAAFAAADTYTADAYTADGFPDEYAPDAQGFAAAVAPGHGEGVEPVFADGATQAYHPDYGQPVFADGPADTYASAAQAQGYDEADPNASGYAWATSAEGYAYPDTGQYAYQPDLGQPGQPGEQHTATGRFEAAADYTPPETGFVGDYGPPGGYQAPPMPQQPPTAYFAQPVAGGPDGEQAEDVSLYARPTNSATSAAPIPAPMSPPPGWAEAPTEYSPGTGERLG